MSVVREIKVEIWGSPLLDTELKCEIFEDTSNILAMNIGVMDKTYSRENPEYYGGHFNIQALKLDAESENWLAGNIARMVAKAVIQSRKKEQDRINKAYDTFVSELERR